MKNRAHSTGSWESPEPIGGTLHHDDGLDRSAALAQLAMLEAQASRIRDALGQVDFGAEALGALPDAVLVVE